MSRMAQIVWWLEQVEAARRAVAEARTERRQPRWPGVLDEDVRARRARVAPLPKTPPAQEIIRGATITGERDEERARSIPAATRSGGAGSGNSPFRRAPTPISGGFSAGSGGGGMNSAGGRTAWPCPATSCRLPTRCHQGGVLRARRHTRHGDRPICPARRCPP